MYSQWSKNIPWKIIDNVPFLSAKLSKNRVTLVVGYTGAKKGSYFKFLRVPACLMQYDLLSILTPFLLKSAKK